jgi:hypothetical protein
LFSTNKAAKVFPGVTGGDHVTGTENPEADGEVAGLRKSSACVTLYFHLFFYGMNT